MVSGFAAAILCYNQGLPMTIRSDGLRRGVAQPGRAPGSGPGGRRFKSSLPDHLFSIRYTPSKSLKIPAVGKNATVLTLAGFTLRLPISIAGGNPIQFTR